MAGALFSSHDYTDLACELMWNSIPVGPSTEKATPSRKRTKKVAKKESSDNEDEEQPEETPPKEAKHTTSAEEEVCKCFRF
jgi:hypothetical protein